MKHNVKTIKEKIRACDQGDAKLVDVLVEVHKCEKEVRKKYLHDKIVEEKGWKEETAERKMALDLLGEA